jgi:hypothetical protein
MQPVLHKAIRPVSLSELPILLVGWIAIPAGYDVVLTRGQNSTRRGGQSPDERPLHLQISQRFTFSKRSGLCAECFTARAALPNVAVDPVGNLIGLLVRKRRARQVAVELIQNGSLNFGLR